MIPLTKPDCDLRDFPFMPLDVVRLRDSDISAISSGDEFRCAVLLWCASWHQLPAASLPDDDVVLAQLAGFGRVVKEWKKVRDGALRGWIKCSDGRLYHPVVAEKANEAWQAKLNQRWKTECARLKKAAQRSGDKFVPPTFEEWLSRNCPSGQSADVPRDKDAVSRTSPSGNAIQGTETGTILSTSPNGDSESVSRDARRPDDTSPPPYPSQTTIPPGFMPDAAGLRLAAQHQLDAELEREKFVAHYTAKAERRENWQAAFRKWLLDAMQFRADRAARPTSARPTLSEQNAEAAARAKALIFGQTTPEDAL